MTSTTTETAAETATVNKYYLIETMDVLGSLPTLMREKRAVDRLSYRAAGKAMGISPNSVYRIEGGCDTTLSSILVILRWLTDTPAPPPDMFDVD